jgi:hypothetical protein
VCYDGSRRRELVRLSEDQHKNCLVRAKPPKKRGEKKYKNSIEMSHCNLGHTSLVMLDAGMKYGFMLQAAVRVDGTVSVTAGHHAHISCYVVVAPSMVIMTTASFSSLQVVLPRQR